MDRSTRVVGTSRSRIPWEASTRPGAPGITLGLLAPWTTSSAHWSSSRPFITRRSARRTLTIRLGRTSRSWAFWLPRARASTSTRSPPTASVSALRSVVVATKRPLSGRCRRGHLRARLGRACAWVSLLERMRRVGAENERGLEQKLVDAPGTAAVQVDAVAARPLGVLVAQPKAQELGGHEGKIGLHGPLMPGTLRVLCPVVPEPGRPQAERPETERLELAIGPPAEPVAVALLVGSVRRSEEHTSELQSRGHLV